MSDVKDFAIHVSRISQALLRPFLYRQIVGIPRGTNSTPLVAELFLFCYESNFMFSPPDNTYAGNVEAFTYTSRTEH